jgi:membrane-bound lytic murein transglycosylase
MENFMSENNIEDVKDANEFRSMIDSAIDTKSVTIGDYDLTFQIIGSRKGLSLLPFHGYFSKIIQSSTSEENPLLMYDIYEYPKIESVMDMLQDHFFYKGVKLSKHEIEFFDDKADIISEFFLVGTTLMVEQYSKAEKPKKKSG